MNLTNVHSIIAWWQMQNSEFTKILAVSARLVRQNVLQIQVVQLLSVTILIKENAFGKTALVVIIRLQLNLLTQQPIKHV